MRQFSGTLLVAFLPCFAVFFGGASTAVARQPVEAARPLAGLDELLTNWERASAKFRTLEATHYRWMYDTVFEVEKRGQGSFYVEGRKRGRLEIAPTKIGIGDRSAKLGKRGSPYKLEPAEPYEWIWSGDRWYLIDHKEKTADCVHLPTSPVQTTETTSQVGFFNWNFFAAFSYLATSPGNAMPLVHDIHADEIKSRFDLKIVQRTGNDVLLIATPKRPRDQECFREIAVILDLNTYLLSAWKSVDSSGNIETSFKFENWRVNQQPGGGANPLAVNIKGYRIHELKSDGTANTTPGEHDTKREPVQPFDAESGFDRFVAPAMIAVVDFIAGRPFGALAGLIKLTRPADQRPILVPVNPD